MWVINMNHLKDAMKSKFTDRNFWIFAFKSNFKNFGLSEFEIKFPTEWYAYNAYFNSRIWDIADVLEKERTQ